MESTNKKFSFSDIVFLLAVIIAFSFTMKIFVLDISRVDSESMEPFIKEGSRIVIAKPAYSLGMPAYVLSWANFEYKLPGCNDVIAFRMPKYALPQSLKRPVVKRVVGLPNDTILVSNNRLYRNNFPLKVNYDNDEFYVITELQFNHFIVIPSIGQRAKFINESNYKYYRKILKNEDAVVSYDKGKVLINGLNPWDYKFKSDYIFVLGDNSVNSYDSRHWGLLPTSRILGKVVYIFQ